jgi:hypothetical protein
MRLAPWRVQTRPAPGLVSVSTRVAAWLALAARPASRSPYVSGRVTADAHARLNCAMYSIVESYNHRYVECAACSAQREGRASKKLLYRPEPTAILSPAYDDTPLGSDQCFNRRTATGQPRAGTSSMLPTSNATSNPRFRPFGLRPANRQGRSTFVCPVGAGTGLFGAVRRRLYTVSHNERKGAATAANARERPHARRGGWGSGETEVTGADVQTSTTFRVRLFGPHGSLAPCPYLPTDPSTLEVHYSRSDVC